MAMPVFSEGTKGALEPETRTAFARNGVEAMGSSLEDLASFQRAERAGWGEVVRRASITADS
jgi:hypothetical protein